LLIPARDYSLTLHDRNNHRVFDNAHSFKPKRQKFGARKVTWDHQHIREMFCRMTKRQDCRLDDCNPPVRVRAMDGPNQFDSPGYLLEYFWKEVDRMIENQRN